MNDKIKPADNWRLDKIDIEFKTYGKDKGKYIGKIRFENGEYESFSFKIRADMAQSYIDLIGEDIVICADLLAKRLIKSLKLD